MLAARDLTRDGTYASFTVTGLSGYTVVIPEPGALALLAAALWVSSPTLAEGGSEK